MSFLLKILSFLLIFLQFFNSNFLIILFFSKNEISEIFVLQRFNFSNFMQLDIGVKSLIFLHKSKYNSLIFLLFSKNEISEIFVLLIFKISNLSKLDMGVKSSISLQLSNSKLFILSYLSINI